MKLLAGVIVVAAAQSGDADSGVARQRAFVSEAAADQAALDAVAAEPEDEYEYYYVYEDDNTGGIARTRGKKTKKKRKKVAGSRPAAQAAAQASNDYADNRNNGFDAFDSFNYNYNTDVFAGLDSDVNSLDLTIASNGKIGVINDAADFVDTQNWAFQHSLWGHAQDTRRTIADTRPARLFDYGPAPTYDVTNNHVARLYDATRENEAKTGKTWNEAMDGTAAAYPYNARWYKLNSENTVAVEPTDVNFGYKVADSSARPSWMTTLDHQDMGAFDSSWELGSPRGNVVSQVDQRWFQFIDNGRNTGTSVANDPARLKCFKCEVQYGLQWDQTNRHFVITGASGANIWADCESSGTDNFQCEYSSGVCFVEERRLFGYTTLVRKGCKQAQACYKNKAQNFLVQAGRQCWPGDTRGSAARVPSRPNDIMADEWIYQLVKGGSLDAGFGQNTGNVANDLASGFDSTFTDGVGLAGGFYRTSGNAFSDNIQSRGYAANGQVLQSWCYQCCNSGTNCNKAWRPETEKDWASNWLWDGSTDTLPSSDQN